MGFLEVNLPRGVAQALIDSPVFLTCWCGKTFQQKAENQLHCSTHCRNLASILRKLMPKIPPSAAPQRPKPRLPSPTPNGV